MLDINFPISRCAGVPKSLGLSKTKNLKRINGELEMEITGFAFGIMGMSMGAAEFTFGLTAVGGLNKLKSHLKEKGILDEDYCSSERSKK